MIYTNESWRPPVTYCEPNKVEGQRMTREEAIKIIEQAKAVVLNNGEYDKAMSMAIEALKVYNKAKHYSNLLNACNDINDELQRYIDKYGELEDE